MEARIFSRGIKRFVTVTVESHHDQGDAIDVTLLEDGTDPSMTMLWRVTGRESVSRVLYTIKHKDLAGLLLALDNFTGVLVKQEEALDKEIAAMGSVLSL